MVVVRLNSLAVFFAGQERIEGKEKLQSQRVQIVQRNRIIEFQRFYVFRGMVPKNRARDVFLISSYGWFFVQLVVEGNWMICTFDSWSTWTAQLVFCEPKKLDTQVSQQVS